MIVDDFHVRWANGAGRPHEADPPLHVDPDAELTRAIALEYFETVASQCAEFVKTCRSIQNF